MLDVWLNNTVSAQAYPQRYWWESEDQESVKDIKGKGRFIEPRTKDFNGEVKENKVEETKNVGGKMQHEHGHRDIRDHLPNWSVRQGADIQLFKTHYQDMGQQSR